MRIHRLAVVGAFVLLVHSALSQTESRVFAQAPTGTQFPQTIPQSNGLATNPLANVPPTAQPASPTTTAQQSPMTANNAVAPSTIRWRPNLAEARAEARQSGKPILLHFYKNDCIYCDKLEKGAFRDPMVSTELEAKFVPVKVFAPDNATATQALKVDRFPTDVIVNADGVVLMRTVSPLDPFAYVSMLSSVSEEHRRIAAQATQQPTASIPSASNPQLSSGFAESGQPPMGPFSAPQANIQPQNSWSNYAEATAGPSNQFTGPSNQFTGPSNQFTGPVNQFAPQTAPIQSFTTQPNGVLASAPQGFANQQPPFEQRQSPEQRQSQIEQSPVQQQPTVEVESVEPMMEGYCLVTLVDDFQWKLGKSDIGAMHLGRLYLFSSNSAREKFLEAPNRYAPVMNGLDVVKFFDEGQIVEGVRAKGCTTENPSRLFFFSSEQTLAKFESNEQTRAYYTQRAIELTERAAAEANGRSVR